MARKVILDVDPGVDDALAVCMALFDPRLEVVAVTAVAGNVSAEQATRNVQTIIEQIDPPRLPRIGCAREPDNGRSADGRHIFGADGMGNADFEVAELHHIHPAEKVICDEVRAAPDSVTILALGPLTNIARALDRDPELASIIGRIVIRGGAVKVGGNVTAAAEFNMFCDPESAHRVFRSPMTKTLVPLDVTNPIIMTYAQLDELPPDTTPAGRLLRRMLPHCFRSHRAEFGLEGMRIHEPVALAALLHPELFQAESMFGDVETRGELTMGATVLDRRTGRKRERPNMEVLTEVDVVGVMDCILRGLRGAVPDSK
ncbi:MAG: nucleoside hydrolase [Planctomycetia bacterium]|nr:nucleoside hydrolase [Planctomycetia bacterium]